MTKTEEKKHYQVLLHNNEYLIHDELTNKP